MLTTLTTQLNQYVDLWIASALLSALDSSAFSASLRLAALLTLAATAVQVAFAPAISRLWGEQKMRQLEHLLRTGATVTTCGLLLGWLPLLLFPGDILGLVFGRQYADAALILSALTAGSAVNVLTGLCGTALMMSGREGIPAIANAVTFVGRIALGVPSAMYWGVTGLAVVSASFTALLNLALAVAVFSLLGLRTWPTLRPRLRLLATTQA
jgi:O-antigen/teichoic acid export membrane protein